MNKNTRYSFFQLFGKGTYERPGGYKLIVPIIQRDYAQGRGNEKAREVRSTFLKQLREYIEIPFGSHDLDFVYGISAPDTDISKKKLFIPLDGQQRLTTLFLLHIYLATRAKGSADSERFFKTMQVKNGKLIESLFSYHTRVSAVDFCNNLVDRDNNFEEIFILGEDNKREYKGSISDYIRNSNWFYPDWYQDPTVRGMLTMLDAIDEKFDKCNHLEALQRLMSDSDPAITFIFMSLEDYKLTDDLYIKMNSRGKPLTPFENFKAKYEQYIGEIEKYGEAESIKELRQVILDRNHKLIKSVKDNFSFNIDTEWSKLFWDFSKAEIRKREEEIKHKDGVVKSTSFDRLLSETLDTKISRFIKMGLVNQYALDHITGSVVIPMLLVDDTPLSFSSLLECDALSADGIVLLTQLFEFYSSRSVSVMPEWTQTYFEEEGVLNGLITGDKGKFEFTFTRRFMLYCYLMFRLNFGDEEVGYLIEWMRFIYNITLDDNSIQDITRNTYQRAVSAVNVYLQLLEKREKPCIIELLSSENCPEKIDFFPEFQIKEEILKSHLFMHDSEKFIDLWDRAKKGLSLTEMGSWGEIILHLESHPYFTGQIGFILKMAGIVDYFEANNNLNWTGELDATYKNKVIEIGLLVSKIFEGGYTGRKMAKDALLERAMLSKFPEYMNDNFFNSVYKRAGSNNLLRDVSWKSLLRLDASKEDIQNKVFSLFETLDIDNPEKSLQEIISSHNGGLQWQKDIISYGYIMSKSKFGFFGKTDDGHIILKDSISFSKGDHEVYSLVLYTEYLYNKFENSGISDFRLAYANSNSWYEIPHIKIFNDKFTVKVKSCVNKDDGELTGYEIVFDTNSLANLESFLMNYGLSPIDETGALYRLEKNWNVDKLVEEYRGEVADDIVKFVTALSLLALGRFG